jgi:hypothetical protein
MGYSRDIHYFGVSLGFGIGFGHVHLEDLAVGYHVQNIMHLNEHMVGFSY